MLLLVAVRGRNSTAEAVIQQGNIVIEMSCAEHLIAACIYKWSCDVRNAIVLHPDAPLNNRRWGRQNFRRFIHKSRGKWYAFLGTDKWVERLQRSPLVWMKFIK